MLGYLKNGVSFRAIFTAIHYQKCKDNEYEIPKKSKI